MGCSASLCSNDAGVVDDSAMSAKDPPKPADPRVLRAENLHQTGLAEEALRALDSIIEDWPSCARAYVARGRICLERQSYEEAISDFSAAIELQSEYVTALQLRARAHLESAHLEESSKDYTSAVRLDPDNAQLQALRVDIQVARRQRAAAESQLQFISHRGSSLLSVAVVDHSLLTEGEVGDPFSGLDTPTHGGDGGARKLCMVCMDQDRGCRLKPCHHAALCVECAEDLMSRHFGCPICDVKIESVEVGAFNKTFAAEDAVGVADLARSMSRASPRLSYNGTQQLSPVRALPRVSESGEQVLQVSGELPANSTADMVSTNHEQQVQAGPGRDSLPRTPGMVSTNHDQQLQEPSLHQPSSTRDGMDVSRLGDDEQAGDEAPGEEVLLTNVTNVVPRTAVSDAEFQQVLRNSNDQVPGMDPDETPLSHALQDSVAATDE
ncbi:hypothetical protein CEUSTIGMA_g9031.t1 [Chlamydomonas eustigma]|uniref:RING-type domain-containing protein n=1 Tax=Chlamydomonas eustigma TaxID=1157962 RepID=A0A250XEW6_9CHLO|nr:hypothetical protein CEUSTIGMA_g9031.t1 [Chlamydomonas eustigma]|eukprot:GAX81603.1 hypothetical protein CEUSTIGMA_g9031.t1 [Chlamydomonas eustigma]